MDYWQDQPDRFKDFNCNATVSFILFLLSEQAGLCTSSELLNLRDSEENFFLARVVGWPVTFLSDPLPSSPHPSVPSSLSLFPFPALGTGEGGRGEGGGGRGGRGTYKKNMTTTIMVPYHTTYHRHTSSLQRMHIMMYVCTSEGSLVNLRRF